DTIAKNIAETIDDSNYNSAIYRMNKYGFARLNTDQLNIVTDLRKIMDEPASGLGGVSHLSSSFDQMFRMQGDTIFKCDKNITVSLGDMTDALTCTAIAEMLESYGVKNYRITEGGASVMKGNNFRDRP